MANTPQSKLQRTKQALDRWLPRLTRAANMVAELSRRQRYYEKLIAQPAPVVVKPVKVETKLTTDVPMLSALLPPVGDLDIPAQFRRPVVNKADEAAKQEIIAAQQAKAKTKTRSRIEKLKAKKAGQTKAMPLTGKAALAAIREGQ